MSVDLVAPLVALTKHNIAPDIQGLLVYGNPLRDVPPGALEAAIAAALSARMKPLEEALRQASCYVLAEAEPGTQALDLFTQIMALLNVSAGGSNEQG